MTRNELINFKIGFLRASGELGQVVRNREGITIEKSADASDEVQYASERA
jgi:hypothetical protein